MTEAEKEKQLAQEAELRKNLMSKKSGNGNGKAKEKVAEKPEERRFIPLGRKNAGTSNSIGGAGSSECGATCTVGSEYLSEYERMGYLIKTSFRRKYVHHDSFRGLHLPNWIHGRCLSSS